MKVKTVAFSTNLEQLFFKGQLFPMQSFIFMIDILKKGDKLSPPFKLRVRTSKLLFFSIV
jgi:hypothetical protein